MNKAIVSVLFSSALLSLTACGEEPCPSVSKTPDVERLGVLLDGGSLCKDEKGVISIDYPKTSVDDVKKKYEKTLGDAGWKGEIPKESENLPIIIFEKGTEKVMVTIGKSKERRVTFALVKHCGDPKGPYAAACVKDITALGEALKK